MTHKNTSDRNENTSILLGARVYGIGGIAVGLVGIFFGRFADYWQPIQSLGDISHLATLACIFGGGFLLSGIAVQLPRFAHAGIISLTGLHSISALLWLPRIFGFPGMLGCWQGLAQALSLVAAGCVAWSFVSNRYRAVALWALFIYGVCVFSYGTVHFTALGATINMVPEWLPPGRKFWAITTGVFDILAALAIVSRVWARLAAYLLTAMIVGFEVLIWLPRIVAKPTEHISWAGNAMNLCFVGAAWIVADWFSQRARLK
ncbi:MAG: hypothetical protein ABIZ04_15675 [Opitutus sp.]